MVNIALAFDRAPLVTRPLLKYSRYIEIAGGLLIIFSSVLVANSTLDGGPVVASTATCINVVDADGDPYGPACESP